MSNKFDKEEIINQITNLNTTLGRTAKDLQGTKTNVDYLLNNGEFKGEFAESTKSYYTEVHGKAIEILNTLVTAIKTAGEKLKTNADAVDSDNSAKIETDYLRNEQKTEIQTAQDAYTTHKAAIQGQMSGVGDIVSLSMPSENFGDKTEDAKRELQTIATKVDDFANQSVVNEIVGLMANFDSLLAYMDSCQTGNGNVKYAAGDLGKQPFYNDLDRNMKIVRGEQLNETAANEETTKVLQSMSQEEQKKFYEEMCRKLGMPYTDEGFAKFTGAVVSGGIELTKFWNTLFNTVTKNGYKADPSILALINKKSTSEVFIEMVGKSEKMTDMFLNAAEKTEKVKLFVKNGAVDYLMNLALKAENMGDVVKSERYLKLAAGIDSGNGTTIKNLKHAIEFATETKDFSKASGWLKNVKKLTEWAKDSKWVGKVGKAANVLGWAAFAANTAINSAENWEKTNGNVGRTITYTAIDTVCDVGPLEAMMIGAKVAGPWGAVGGFIVGGVWQGAQAGFKYFGIDIRQGMKDTIGNALGDGLNSAGNGIKKFGENVGNAVSGAWKNITGGFHFGW